MLFVDSLFSCVASTMKNVISASKFEIHF